MKTKVNQIFTKQELVGILDNCIGKTLSEVDSKNLLNTQEGDKGIAGHIIEQSVLGYPPDTEAEPDLLVDGIETELKTTGLLQKKDTELEYKPKEYISVTAVSIDKILAQEFETSQFWHKLEHLLFVYYHYNKKPPVPSTKDYGDFPILNYDFYEFSEKQKNKLKNDWCKVYDCIDKIYKNYTDDVNDKKKLMKYIKDQFIGIHHELNTDLMVTDLAPKWPPRFRLRSEFAESIIARSFGKTLDTLDEDFSSFREFDSKLSEITQKYKNKTIKQIFNELNTECPKKNKALSEKLLIAMFGGTSKRLNDIDCFKEMGLKVKSITISENDTQTEAMKFFPIDFSDIERPIQENLEDIDYFNFESSQFYSEFSSPYLFVFFKESDKGQCLENNIFQGFKRYSFSEEFINNYVQSTWYKVRDLVINKKLVFEECHRKDGTKIINKKTKTVKGAPNFPKEKDNIVFVKGGGFDASKKSLEINGIQMYTQFCWIKGNTIISLLNDIDFV